jgi:hypothetical protein
LASLVLGACLFVSEGLRLIRRHWPASTGLGAVTRPHGAGVVVLLAFSETVLVLGTGLAVYLSVNAVTHPATLEQQATHLLSWPTEGTLRIVALGLSVASAAVLRYLRAGQSAKPAGAKSESRALEVLTANDTGTR